MLAQHTALVNSAIHGVKQICRIIGSASTYLNFSEIKGKEKMRLLTKILGKTHKIWSRVLPSFYRAYNLPTGGKIYIDITESSMMFARVFGDFEPQKHRALDFFLEKGDAYIDIGANKGEFAIHAALKVGAQGNILAFEPEPENCKWIRKSIEESVIHNITLVEGAVGSENGSLNLYIGEKSGWHSLVNSEHDRVKKSIPVNVYQLDGYLEKMPLPNLKAIKIDVEGFEKEVLIGAYNTLRLNDDLMLFIDIHPSHGVVHDEIYEILHEHGFSLYKEKYPFNLPIDKNSKPLEIVAIKDNKSAEQFD
jgi:FkbM family methyltransferase